MRVFPEPVGPRKRRFPTGRPGEFNPAQKTWYMSTRDCIPSSLRAKIVGQEEGIQSLVDMYQVFCAGLNSPGRPVGNLLFLGQTGSGKTRILEAPSETLVAGPRA